MFIPQQSVLSRVCVTYQIDTILLYQNQATPKLFDFYIARREYCKSSSLDVSVKEFVYSLVGGKSSRIVFYKQVTRVGRQYPDDVVRKQMLSATGYNIARQLVDIIPVDKKSVAYHAMGNAKASGRIFDVAEFQRQILKAIENIIFFTQNPLIRALRVDSNKATQRACLRMLDHRPLIQDIWHQGVKFVLEKHPPLQTITQEQHSSLFNTNYQSVMTLFNSLVMGDPSFIVQPHPVRALLDHLPYLTQTNCFDLSMYSMEGATLNQLVASYYIGKNFLTCDEQMQNTQGAICFSGAPGSGKSHLVSILYEFMNGFNYQDTPKGMTEFQNYDIVTKSFIKCEEVFTKRLAQPDWKMLADLQVALKCKIKNQQDVEVTKNVPVVITTNDDVFQAIIDRANRGDANYQAVHRRWAFVRYFYSWQEKHGELFDANGALKREYADIYQGVHTPKALMNSLIALALFFGNIYLAMPDYILPYYAHCLQQFSLTMFGSFAFKQRLFLVDLCKYLSTDMYLHSSSIVAKAELGALSRSIEEAFIKHWQVLLKEQNLQQQLLILENETMPLYKKALLLGFDSEVLKILTAHHRLSLLVFLTSPDNTHLERLRDFMYPAESFQQDLDELMKPSSGLEDLRNQLNASEQQLESSLNIAGDATEQDWTVQFNQFIQS